MTLRAGGKENRTVVMWKNCEGLWKTLECTPKRLLGEASLMSGLCRARGRKNVDGDAPFIVFPVIHSHDHTGHGAVHRTAGLEVSCDINI